MSALPYMQFYIAEYLADTAHLTTIQHGAYMLLLMNYWQRGKALKNSNERLANVARMSNEEWNSARETLAEFFTVTNEEWIHNRVERDLAKVAEKSSKASASGKSSAIKRSERTLNERSTNAQPLRTDKEEIREEHKEQVQIPSAAPAGERRKRERREPDPRHTTFREAFRKYFLHKLPSLTQEPWDEQEAANLAKFLKKNPEFTLEQWQRLLRNRGNSPVSHGDGLSAWIGRAMNWADGPTDGFGKPAAPGGTNGQHGAYKGKTESSIDAARIAIQAIENRAAAERAWHPETGEASPRGLPGLCD